MNLPTYEIEKKFLLRDLNGSIHTSEFFEEHFPNLEMFISQILEKGSFLQQHYLPSNLAPQLAKKYGVENPELYSVARIRSVETNSNFIDYLTLKSEGTTKRLEFEKEISIEEFEKYIKKSLYGLTKKRLVIPLPTFEELKIEADLFMGNTYSPLNKLLLAEIEVPNEIVLQTLPNLGKDVSENRDYTNLGLAKLNSKK